MPQRSGAEAGRTPCLKAGGQEELPHVRGQGQRLGVAGCNSPGMAEKSYPVSEVRGSGWEELPHTPTPKARGGGREDQPHIQGVVSARTQKGIEELTRAEGQEGQQ